MQLFLTFNLSFCYLATVLATFLKIGQFFQTFGHSSHTFTQLNVMPPPPNLCPICQFWVGRFNGKLTKWRSTSFQMKWLRWDLNWSVSQCWCLDIQHNVTQHNNIQPCGTQYNTTKCSIERCIMQGVAFKPIMLCRYAECCQAKCHFA